MKTCIPLLAAAALCSSFSAMAEGDPNQLLNLKGIPKEQRTILPREFTWPEKPGEAALCLWKDDKVAALSYTIDDNCAMNIDWWLKEAAERDIKLTWFLVAAGVSGSNPAMNGKWEDWQKVRDAGHGLESHSMTHLSGSRNMDTWKGIEWEYKDSKETIDAGLGGGYRTACLAYPGGSYPGKNDPEVAAKYFIAARGTKAMLNGPQGLDYLGVNAMSKSNFGERPEKDFNNADNLMNPDSKQGYRGWCVVLNHYVKENDPAVTAKVRKDLDYAVKNRDSLWVGRFGDIARYAQSRETATLGVKENRPDRIVVGLADRMDDRYFDYPLTVKVRLPSAWHSVSAKQNGQPVPARTIEHEGGKFALVDIVPDRGETVLTQ